MLDELTETQFREWMAFDSISPFGEDRADLRNALSAAAICNSLGASVTTYDFLPYITKPEQTAEQQLAIAQTIAAAAGAKPGGR